MGIYKELPANLVGFDVIVAGGGTAGCIVASRLAEADLDLSILLVESGLDNYLQPQIIHPAFLYGHVLPDNRFAKLYKGSNSRFISNRSINMITGGTLGGGSSINFAIYSRAQRSDFDSWNVPNWGAENMLPYMKKLETYHGDDPLNRHGSSGPVHITRVGYRSTKFENDFINSANSLGYPETDDINDLDQINCVTRALRHVGPDGTRQDTAHRYLHPLLRDGKHPNLHVLVETEVEKVVLQAGKANGIIVRPNRRFQEGRNEYASREIKARRMVVLSGGAIGSPLILQRSGIGDPSVLERAGIPVLSSLPDVGRNYDDHQIINYAYKSGLAPEDTLDAFNTRRISPDKLIAEKAKLLSWNGLDLQCKVRPSEEEVTKMSPETQAAWDRSFRNYPDKAWQILNPVSCLPGHSDGIDPGQYVGIGTITCHPLSRGHVFITGPSIDDELDFDAGALSNESDVLCLLWAYKKQRELMRRLETYRGEVPSWHPPFPAHSKAKCIETDGPLPSNIPDIEYSTEDDKIIKQFIRDRVNTAWHAVSTCRIEAPDQPGVVDPALNVLGVEQLKVADLSVLPGNVGANTVNTAMTIGEKAADIIIKELRISPAA